MLNVITDNIDIWTSAQKKKKAVGRGSSKKFELYGIKKLRGLILDLAVKGKLVEQISDDEHADELLKAIYIEKNSSKVGTKKQKLLSEIKEKDKLYIIPDNWSWARLGNIGETNIGLTYSPKNVGDKGIPVLRSTNVQKGKIDLADLVRVDMNVKDSAYVENNDLIICARNGSKSLVGKTAMIRNLEEPMAFGAFMAIFRSTINPYIEIFLNSPTYRRNLEGTSTTTINQITQSNLKETLVSIPPLSEQHRIVKKVEKLMALCDQLEQEETYNKAAHQTLVRTLLATLTSVETADEFTQSWQRISEHFDILFTTQESVEELKQTILQLAVMGKLVPQDPNNEPVSELLKRIDEEKERLIKEKKIKKPKKLLETGDDEQPFDIPNTWKWSRLQEVSKYIQRGKGPKYSDLGKVRVISQKCIQLSGFNLEKSRYVDDTSLSKYQEERFLQNNDLLWNSTDTGTVGRINVLEDVNKDSLVADSHVTVIRPMLVSSKFLQNYISSTGVQTRFDPKHENTLVSGTTNQVELNTSTVLSLVIPIPPLNEQERIVRKVDELIVLCDSLKANISEAQNTQVSLADAIVEKVI